MPTNFIPPLSLVRYLSVFIELPLLLFKTFVDVSKLKKKQPTVGQQDVFLRHAARLRAAQSDGVTSVLPAP